MTRSLTFGIMGYGAFGKLLARLIGEHNPVIITSRRPLTGHQAPQNCRFGSLSDLSTCDVIILCCELEGLEASCKNLKNIVKPETIVMDVCSVKILPVEIMQRELQGHCRLLATHPLWGPQSIGHGPSNGYKIVWHTVAGGPFPELEDFFSTALGLEILTMSPDEHDKHMAWVHCLTSFIARGALQLNPPTTELSTKFYEQLVKLLNIERGHSLALFKTMHLGNPYSKVVREHLIKSLHDLDEYLKREHL